MVDARTEPNSEARVAIIYSGGTIGMRHDAAGHLVPDARVLSEHLESAGAALRDALPEYELLALPPLKDSAELGPRDWWLIAAMIVEERNNYAGFVVVHGTDTMAYTASALSFMLEGLDRPVVVTGAQLSLVHPRSDGRENLATAMMIACGGPKSQYCPVRVPEVCVYFAQTLLRGNRTQKHDTDDFVAFRSPNYPILGRAGVEIAIETAQLRAPGLGLGLGPRSPERVLCALHSDEQALAKVAALRVYPGLDADLLQRFLSGPLDALVLETYGTGTLPSHEGGLMRALEAAVARGVVIVNCSQCPGGRIRQGRYGAGASLADIGVIGGGSMTPEAALAKLHYLLGHFRGQVETVRQQMSVDMAGEGAD